MDANISQDVVARIKALPPLPTVTRKLVAVMQNDNCSADAVTKVLSSDQALASQVLKLVNSSFYGMTGKVSLISRAVVILGFSAVRNLATGLGVAKVLQGQAGEVDLQTYWGHAIGTAVSARTIAEITGHMDPEEAFVAGLLHDLGALVIDMVAPGALAGAWLRGGDIIQKEMETLGISHTKAGQKLMRHWKLPESLCECVRFHHHADAYRSDESHLIATIVLADIVTQGLGWSHEPQVTSARLFEVADALGLSLRQTRMIFARARELYASAVQFLALPGMDPAPAQEPEAANEATGGNIVVLTGNADHAGWIAALIARAGCRLIPMQDFVARSEVATTVDGIIIDTDSITAEQCGRLSPLLSSCPGALLTFGDHSASDPQCHEQVAGALPTAFQPHDLTSVLQTVAAAR